MVCRRANAVSEYEDFITNTFGPLKIPHELAWGTSNAPHNPTDDVLCYKGKPVQFWIVGDIARMFFVNDDGPRGQPGLAISPFVPEQGQQLIELAKAHSKPSGMYCVLASSFGK